MLRMSQLTVGMCQEDSRTPKKVFQHPIAKRCQEFAVGHEAFEDNRLVSGTGCEAHNISTSPRPAVVEQMNNRPRASYALA